MFEGFVIGALSAILVMVFVGLWGLNGVEEKLIILIKEYRDDKNST